MPHSPPTVCPSFQDYLDALAGVCYDGIEGLLYLGLFSLLAALAFSTMICAGPRAWKHFTTRWAPWRGFLGELVGGSALPELRADKPDGQGQQRTQAFGPSGPPGCLQKVP